MAGRITMWGAGELLSNFFTGGMTLPENFYLALIKDTGPTSYVSGSELDEPQVASYSRLALPATSLVWSNEGQPHVIVMNQDLNFGVATEDWGTIRYWALCNALTDGFVYAVGDCEPFYVSATETVQIFSGDLAITVGPFYADKEL